MRESAGRLIVRMPVGSFGMVPGGSRQGPEHQGSERGGGALGARRHGGDGCLEALQARLEELPLDGAQAVDEEDAVEMVELVLDRAREETLGGEREGAAVLVLRLHLDRGPALHVLAVAGDAE